MTMMMWQARKNAKEKISMVSCYDYISAKLVSQSKIDALLVGDTLAMLVYGHPTTVPATIDMMTLHTGAVVRGAPNKFVVADLPFLSYRQGLIHAMRCVEKLMQAGAQAIKLEGAQGNFEFISHMVSSGVPVMGHLGLMPQFVNQVGGFCVQGKDETIAKKILADAVLLQSAGCFALVLECVPVNLGQEITQTLNIPTIGIGAGPYTDGQVLLFHDLLGFNLSFKPKFLKTYFESEPLFLEALNHYDQEVKAGIFPSLAESYSPHN